ncbi:MAG: putative bifunctional diguanylate cyclase/phosphodiesterase [Limnobacter sp.]|uniref:putative bifunctional diguanylate cyclase/phosphodiesterase n=1 Tax=Limnobacter sp. TaxID=2003368 RepID=UPI00391977C7
MSGQRRLTSRVVAQQPNASAPRPMSASLIWIVSGLGIFIGGLLTLLLSHTPIEDAYQRHGWPVPAVLGTLAILMVFWINQAVIRPLRRLNEQALSLIEGDLHEDFPSSPIREIDLLSNTFRIMSRHLHERDSQIRRTAYTDQLTGLDNRAFLNLALTERMSMAREPLSLFVWGIDNFESIKEVLGHDMAEQVLVKMAQKARRLCQDNLTVARLDGHHFCLLLPTSEFRQAWDSQRLHSLLKGAVRVDDYTLDLETHAGYAHYPAHAQHPDQLLKCAELARQVAQKTGQAALEFEPRMRLRSSQRLGLISELKAALLADQFCLHFQPKLNLRTNSINQAEVLLRWNHPERGLLPPGTFIELAEQTGLIRDISRWVVRKVYEVSNLCSEQNIRLSMNLSAMDLDDDGLLHYIETLHATNPHAAKHITLEITESAAMRNPEHALELLRALTDMGFQIAIDDYGAGYSSLAYLKRFPVTELKIDRSLVQGADIDLDSQIILESTIQMGHTMGLVVTTEGVEHDGEFEVVRKLGVDYVQGYWLSKPMPYEEFSIKHLVGNRLGTESEELIQRA